MTIELYVRAHIDPIGYGLVVVAWGDHDLHGPRGRFSIPYEAADCRGNPDPYAEQFALEGPRPR